ncbi:MAG: tetratricopeptide repeat protein, partial [Pyrinomonadaceae bacterium]|nr:tetratricopeptide repeat protein [Phycisphaerales bacterium]
NLAVAARGTPVPPTPAAPGSAYSPGAPSASGSLAPLPVSPAAPPRALRRQLQGELDWIILKCLEKDRDRRYHTAQELAQDIGRHLANQPVLAGPPSISYRVSKFVRRHRGPLGAGALVVLALVVGLALAIQGYIRANLERDSAARAVKFLQEIITSSDPNKGLQAGVTIREALDLASIRLDRGALKGDAGVEATIRRTLGSTYMAMGLYEKAAPHLEQALILFPRVFGERSMEAGEVWNDLGELKRQLGDYPAANIAYLRAMEIQRPFPPSISKAQTLNNLGLLRQAQGRFEEAVDLQQQALDIRITVSGHVNHEVATSYQNLGSVLVSMGRLAEAEDRFRECLNMRINLLTPHHFRVANTQLSLAILLGERGELNEAESLATRAIAVTEKTLGPAHAQMGRGLGCLGRIRELQGRLDEAGELFQRSLDVRRQALPAGHPEIAVSLYNLGNYLVQRKQFDKAEPALREALQIRMAKLNPGHPQIEITASVLGESLVGLGKLDEARKLLAGSLAALKSNPYSTEIERSKAADRLTQLAHTPEP